MMFMLPTVTEYKNVQVHFKTKSQLQASFVKISKFTPGSICLLFNLKRARLIRIIEMVERFKSTFIGRLF